MRYVALGDSYTAAPGVPELDAAGGCFRSTNNYPAVVVRTVQVKTWVDRSCSAAETTDLAGPQRTPFNVIPPQFAALTPTTDLVTLGIGGNDFSVFGSVIDTCGSLRASDPSGAPCRSAMRVSGQDRLLTAISRIQARVTRVLAQIHQRSPRAKILVVGYPQIVPAQGTCTDLLPLATGDYAYARQINHRLTLALRAAAAVRRVGYVDVWRASSGHDICSADPWVNGQVSDPSRAQAFHPFAVEQQAVAGLIATRLGY